jgi:hypothetical protein
VEPGSTGTTRTDVGWSKSAKASMAVTAKPARTADSAAALTETPASATFFGSVAFSIGHYCSRQKWLDEGMQFARPRLEYGRLIPIAELFGGTYMRAFTVILAMALTTLSATAPVVAQEGHPLKGSWLGTWAGNKSHSPDLVMVLNWDGKAITGMINPGTDNIPIKSATLNPEGWVVHFEADAKDKAGTVLNYVIDGKIENLAVANRTVTGTWKNQKEGGAFKMGRQ